MLHQFSRWGVVAIILLIGVMACSQLSTTTPSSTLVDTPIWTQMSTGVEYRTIPVQPPNAPNFNMHVVRINPSQVQFRVHYQGGDPYLYTRWQALLQNQAIVFVNANFFTEDNQAIGLVIADGQAYSTSLYGYGGMFQVDSTGSVRLRALRQEPYRGEFLQQAIQSFPMLINNGTQSPSGSGFDDNARRTIIAQDYNGNILLMTTGILGEISFNDLQSWLINSGLNVNIAFALDGGKSTAMYVANQNGNNVVIPALTAIPTILAVYPN